MHVANKRKAIIIFCLNNFIVVIVQLLSDPMNCSRPGLPALHYLLVFAGVHVNDTIQPSHPLPPSSFAFNLSQHQDLFQWVGSLHLVAKLLELQLHYQSFQWIFRVDFSLGLIALISLLSKGLSTVFSSNTVPGLLHCRKILYLLSHQESPNNFSMFLFWSLSVALSMNN